MGCETWGGRLTTAFTAHPKRCPLTGELHFFGYGVFPPYLTYHVLDAAGELVKSEPITVPGPTMMHDFMYILYFQEPGVAEADLEKDVRRTIRGFMSPTRRRTRR